MFDGFESARSRVDGHTEECVVGLAQELPITRIALDFTHYVNNNPRAVRIEGLAGDKWIELVAQSEVKAFAASTKIFAVRAQEAIRQLRVTVVPDGGINRLRAYSIKV